MVRARLQGINTVRKRLADGTVRTYHYHRATGAALSGKPGSPEFLRDYGAAEQTLLDRHSGTFNGLVRDYTLSPEFGKLRDSTQREYRRMLTKAEVKFGTMPLAALEDPRVTAGLHGLAQRRGDGIRRSRSRQPAECYFGDAELGDRERARFQQPHRRLPAAAPRRSLRADLVARAHSGLHERAPVELQRALILALHTGQRQGDLLAADLGQL